MTAASQIMHNCDAGTSDPPTVPRLGERLRRATSFFADRIELRLSLQGCALCCELDCRSSLPLQVTLQPLAQLLSTEALCFVMRLYREDNARASGVPRAVQPACAGLHRQENMMSAGAGMSHCTTLDTPADCR